MFPDKTTDINTMLIIKKNKRKDKFSEFSTSSYKIEEIPGSLSCRDAASGDILVFLNKKNRH